MKKGVVFGIGSVLLVGIAIGGYFLWRNTRNPEKESENGNDGDAGGGIDVTPPTIPSNQDTLPPPTQGCPNKSYTRQRNDAFPLKWGSEGANVGRLQRALNLKLDYNLSVDNKFGCLTESALRQALRKNEISQTELDSLENQ
jgi:peptidoglycan hydrolase-like protein with peptidoglycan-binding domain